MRTERCACGGPPIVAMSPAAAVDPIIEHNRTPEHALWRSERSSFWADLDLEKVNLRPIPYDPRRRWPTAVDDSRDVSGNTDGASAIDVEGAA